jgi:hypothetical protein
MMFNVISTADALSGSHAFQHKFQLFIAWGAQSLETPGFTEIS